MLLGKSRSKQKDPINGMAMAMALSIGMGYLRKWVEELKKVSSKGPKDSGNDGDPFVHKEKKVPLRDQTDEILGHPIHTSLSHFAFCHISLPPPCLLSGLGRENKD